MLKYSEEIHAARLGRMFDEEKWDGCPATLNFNPEIGPNDIWSKDSDPCEICREFLGLSKFSNTFQDLQSGKCPCHALGEREAQIRTRERLLEYYNLKNGRDDNATRSNAYRKV